MCNNIYCINVLIMYMINVYDNDSMCYILIMVLCMYYINIING